MENRIIGIGNAKGGATKSTTTVNLAATLCVKFRKKCLVVDLDPQATASIALNAELNPEVVIGYGTGDLMPYVQPYKPPEGGSSIPGLSIVPAHRHLQNLEDLLEEGGVATKEQRLQRVGVAIGQLPKEWDYVFLDPPPSYSFHQRAFLRATRDVLLVTDARQETARGVMEFVDLMEEEGTRVNPHLNLLGVLMNRVRVLGRNWERIAVQVKAELDKAFGDLVFPMVVRDSVRASEANSWGVPLALYDPEGITAKDFAAAADELRGRVVAAAAKANAPMEVVG